MPAGLLPVHFFSLHHNNFSTLSRQRRFNIFKTKTHQSITMFDQDGLHLCIAQQTHHAFALPIKARTHFLNGINDHHLVRNGVFGQPG